MTAGSSNAGAVVGVVAEVAGEAYAFPLLRTERILRLPRSEVKTLGSAQYFLLGDANVSLVCAQQILGFGLPAIGQDDLCVVVSKARELSAGRSRTAPTRSFGARARRAKLSSGSIALGRRSCSSPHPFRI